MRDAGDLWVIMFISSLLATDSAFFPWLTSLLQYVLYEAEALSGLILTCLLLALCLDVFLHLNPRYVIKSTLHVSVTAKSDEQADLKNQQTEFKLKMADAPGPTWVPKAGSAGLMPSFSLCWYGVSEEWSLPLKR